MTPEMNPNHPPVNPAQSIPAQEAKPSSTLEFFTEGQSYPVPMKLMKTLSFEGGPIPSEADIEDSRQYISKRISATCEISARDLIAYNTSTTSTAPVSEPITVDSIKAMSRAIFAMERQARSTPRPIAGICCQPEFEAHVRAVLTEETAGSELRWLFTLPIYVFAAQAEQIRVFFDRDELLQHVAEMTLNIGDIVAPVTRLYALRSGCGAYDDAVVASVNPFVLISREGDMKWSATVKPWHYGVTGRADEATMTKVNDRLIRDLARQ